MEKTDIQRLRDIPIRSLCGLLGIEVDERGRCLCPFHDDHHLGSCYVGVRGRNTLSCWSCGKRGVDTIALTQHVLGKGFLEACQYLAEQYGCTPGPLGPPSPLKGEKIHLDGRPPSPLKGEKIHMNTGTIGGAGHVITGTIGDAGHMNTGTIGGAGHVITGTIGDAGHMNTGTIGASTSSNYSPLRGLGGPVGGPVGPVGLRPTLSRHFIHPVLNAAARHFLYDERHISPRVASWYRLNSWTDRHGTPWLELPYYSAEGRLIGVQNRRLSPCPVTSPLGTSPLGTSPSTPLPSCPVTSLPSCPQTSPLPLWEGQGGGSSLGGGSSSSPRCLFQPGSRTSTFGLQIIPYLRPTDELWIAEGPTDLLAMASAGHRGIAIASATLIRPEDFLPLKERGILRWRMVHDNDSAGLQARDRIIQLANQLGASIIATPPPAPCKDFGEWWARENEKANVTASP